MAFKVGQFVVVLYRSDWAGSILKIMETSPQALRYGTHHETVKLVYTPNLYISSFYGDGGSITFSASYLELIELSTLEELVYGSELFR